MARDGGVIRARLLDAGMRLAQAGALSGLRVDEIGAGAGVGKGTFYVHFPARSAFLAALHQRFQDQPAVRIERTTAETAPGLARLRAGSPAYPDGCRAQSAIKAMLLGARSEPEIQHEVAAQNARFGALVGGEFRAAGWPAPEHAARLWVGLVAEGAVAEAEARRRQPPLRATLARYLGATPV
jgi:AcrR family transcriptional regulator